MRETTNLNWLAGFLNHQQYHLVSQQFKQCEHELEWINGLYHVVMRLSRINGMGVESTQHLPNDEECQHWGKPMVNEPLIRPYFWEGTLESVVGWLAMTSSMWPGPWSSADATAALQRSQQGQAQSQQESQHGKRFFSARRSEILFDIVLREARSDGFFRCLDCLVPVLKANFFSESEASFWEGQSHRDATAVASRDAAGARSTMLGQSSYTLVN